MPFGVKEGGVNVDSVWLSEELEDHAVYELWLLSRH
jgi:hypothetical protein